MTCPPRTHSVPVHVPPWIVHQTSSAGEGASGSADPLAPSCDSINPEAAPPRAPLTKSLQSPAILNVSRSGPLAVLWKHAGSSHRPWLCYPRDGTRSSIGSQPGRVPAQGWTCLGLLCRKFPRSCPTCWNPPVLRASTGRPGTCGCTFFLGWASSPCGGSTRLSWIRLLRSGDGVNRHKM
jgi:hypothetical protein